MSADTAMSADVVAMLTAMADRMDGQDKTAPSSPEPTPAEPPAEEAAKSDKKPKKSRSISGVVAVTDTFFVEQVAEECLRGWYCWCPQLGWMRWNSRVWERVEPETVRDEVRQYVAQWVVGQIAQPTLGVPHEDIIRLASKGRVSALTDLAAGILLVPGEDFDRDPDLITVENGVLDLRDSTILPHDPDRYLTRYIPTAYVPSATHEDWVAALAAVEPDVAEWLQLRFGQGITGHTPDDDVMVLLHGDGENGKSTVIDSLTLALGGRTTTGAITFLDDAVLSGDRDAKEERMALKGARLAFAEELPEGRRLNVVQLKKAVGTAQMKARHLYQREVQWVTSHTLVITTNYKPMVAETDHGTWRRLALVPFPYTFVKGEPTADYERAGDAAIKARMARRGQREAVLSWLVAGARRWYDAGRKMPKHPPAVLEATRQWRGESDMIMRFWDECLTADMNAHVMSTELLTELNSFLKTQGQKEWSQKTGADRFGSHEETKRFKVAKVLMRNQNGLSRPPVPPYLADTFASARPTPPAQYTAWRGMRFSSDG
ncbi:putative DNA primase/helicase [Kitasatospora sp. GAS204A]|uniref:DNA primase family protein n=1 Tax=unclassified Kitasatospora TaxID=2633591 RepID=UPI0024754613|nr:phage/plasmid primase, P4 family [Kitasatospora sp. GAS204B]MDH6122034.1 putative DNA primase/helicase [Kitasatospora sp. GAS204B]